MGAPGKTVKVVNVMPWVCLFLRLGLAFLFIYGGFTKLMEPKAFARLLSSYALVPEILLPVVAIGLPLLETLAGIGLAFDIKGSLGVVSGLLVLFIFVLWYGVVSDLAIDCGCFGVEEIMGHKSLTRAFYRDLGLIGVVTFLYCAKWAGARMGIPICNIKLRRRTENVQEF